MSDLADTLLQAIADLERTDFDATKGPWEWQDFGGDNVELVHPRRDDQGRFTHPMNVLKTAKEDWPPANADRRHIVANHPAVVLRRCAADRETVKLCRTVMRTQHPESNMYLFAWSVLADRARGYGLEAE